MGIVFRFRGSTGGTDIAAKLAAHYTGLSLGEALLAVDALVVIAAGVVFSPEFAMYALFAIFVTSKMIDIVQEGLYSGKALFIISAQSQAIADALLHQLGRGVTVFPSRGAYSNTPSETLLCVVGRGEIGSFHEPEFPVQFGMDALQQRLAQLGILEVVKQVQCSALPRKVSGLRWLLPGPGGSGRSRHGR